MKEAFKTKASKMRTKYRIAGMEIVAEKTCKKLAEHTAQVTQLVGDLHELKGKLDFSENRNNDATLRYSIFSDECDFLKRQIASCGVRSGKMIQQLANASKHVDA